jgi:hypothetical protein
VEVMGTLPAVVAAAVLSVVPVGAQTAPGEAVDSIRLAFQREDPRLYWTQVLQKKELGPDSAVMLVEAAPLRDTMRSGFMNPDRGQSRLGLFQVAGPGNRVVTTIDVFTAPHGDLSAVVEAPMPGRVYVHWHGSYGGYVSSFRYDYAPGADRRARKTEYGRFALEFVTAEGTRLYYRALYDQEGAPRPLGYQAPPSQAAGLIFDVESREFTITSTPPSPLAERSPPAWVARWLSRPASDRAARPRVVRLERGLWAAVSGTRLRLFRPGERPVEYQSPGQTRERIAELRPELRGRGLSVHHIQPNGEIGAVAAGKGSVWYLHTFYDGEGQSGAGFLGRIRVGEPTIETLYLPEMTCCSGTALHVTHEYIETVFAGLAQRPEGAWRSHGLLRHVPSTGETQVFGVPDVIRDIRGAGGSVALATDHGLYLLEDERLAQYRLEPAVNGGLELVTIALP